MFRSFWYNIIDLLSKIFYFLKPLQIIWRERTLFFIWILLVFAGSSLGVIFTYFVSLNFESTLLNHLQKGNIYLISISLVAAFISDLLASLLLEYKEKKEGEKKEIYFIEQKIILIVLFIFLLAIMASIFTNIDNQQILNKDVIENLQYKFYVLTLLLGIYAFCLKHTSLYPDDFKKFISKRTAVLQNANPSQDSEGNQL